MKCSINVDSINVVTLAKCRL